MRRLLIVCILGIIFFTTGCNDNPFSPGETAFFPLNVGNTWIYESDSGRFGPPFENKVEIVGVSNIAGRSYFVFETIYHSSATSPAYRDTSYFRSDGEGKIFGFRDGEEFLYIDFNREVNEKWQSQGEYIGVIQGKNKIVEVPAGRFTNVTQVYFDIPQYADDEFCENYAPGVGRLDISCLFGVPMYLKSARIDGKHYRAENLNPDRVIIIEDPLNFNPDSIEIDAFRIQFYSIYDDTLQLTVSHSGGCAQHDFKLYSTRGIYLSIPPQADVWLSHNGNGDSCEAWLTEDLFFDLSPLKESPTGALSLRLHQYQESEPIEPFPLYEW